MTLHFHPEHREGSATDWLCFSIAIAVVASGAALLVMGLFGLRF